MLQTKQWIADLKMNGSVTDVAFTPNSRHLLSIGSTFIYLLLMGDTYTHTHSTNA